MFDFSIIIPVYNVEKYLKECVDSCLKQIGTKNEIILIDDGSTDSSGLICDDYAKDYDFIKVVHQQNGGLSVARNRAVLIASGKYIVFLDSDDYIVPSDAFKTFFEKMEENSLDVLWGDMIGGGAVNKAVRFKSLNKVISCPEFLKESIDNEAYDIVSWLKIIRRDFFIKNSLFFKENCYYEDQEYTLKLLLIKESRLMRIDYPFYFYRENPSSVTHLRSLKNATDLIEVIRSMIGEAKSVGESKDVLKYAESVVAIAIYHLSAVFVRLSLADQKEVEKIIRNDKQILRFARKTYKLSFRMKLQNRLFIFLPFVLRLIYGSRNAQ